MKKNIKKLRLNKLAVAKLSNSKQIRGGGGMSDDYLCPSEGALCESIYPWNSCPPRVNQGGPGNY